MTRSTLSEITFAETLQKRYALAWQYLAESAPSKKKITPSGIPSAWMCWKMLHAHASQGTRSARINKTQCWEIVCSFVNNKGANE